MPDTASAIRLLPLLFLRPERGARYIRQGTPRGMAKNIGTGAISATLAFDPAKYVPYFETKLIRGSEVWAAVSCAGPEGFGRNIQLTAKFLDKLTRNEIPVSLSVLDKAERNGAVVFFVRLAIPEVEPGEYRFIILAEGVGQPSAIVKDVIIE
jgi:hypothetical protein